MSTVMRQLSKTKMNNESDQLLPTWTASFIGHINQRPTDELFRANRKFEAELLRGMRIENTQRSVLCYGWFTITVISILAVFAIIVFHRDAKTYYIFYYSKLFTELVSVPKLLSRLEAAIGIEPMNKGFAVIANLLAQDRDCIRVCIFIKRVDNSCLCVIA